MAWSSKEQDTGFSNQKIRVRIPFKLQKVKNEMSKIDKKKNKVIERIKFLEEELVMALTKKTSDTKEINVPLQQRKIQELKIQLSKM